MQSAHTDTFCRDNLPPSEQWPELLFSLPELHYPERLNCAEELLDASVARYGADRPCLLTGSETWTYGDLLRRVNQTARVLSEDLGLVPGNRVLLRGPNGPWLIAAWFAVLKAGGVAITTMPMLRSSEIGTLVELSRPDFAICDHRYTADLAAAVPGVPTAIYGGSSDDDLISRSESKQPSCFTAVATAADDVALLAPTSGTTGVPKVTAHFHRDLLAINETFGRHVLAARPDDIFAGTPPLGFTFGLGGLAIFPLSVGAAVLLIERATPDGLADAIADHGVTTLFTAPTMYRALLGTGKNQALTSLRTCVSAGEHMPATVWEDFHAATGVKIVDGIGSTELLHIFISAVPDRIRPGSTGQVVPGFRATVLDDDGQPVPDGVAGHLAVKGPTGCLYLSDDRQRDYVIDGWNITGDTYIRDADGYYWYQARSDDMIVSSGYKIAGPEVEQALLGHSDVLEAGVVAAPDSLRQSIVKAYVVLQDGISPSPDKAIELQNFTKQAIAPYKYPRSIEFVDSLPRTVTGKMQRFLLRESAARHVGPSRSSAPGPPSAKPS